METTIRIHENYVRKLNHVLPLTQAYPVPTYPILHRHLPLMQSALTSQFAHLSTKGSQKKGDVVCY